MTLALEQQPAPIQVQDDDTARVALELAAAFLVVRGLVSAWLGAQEPDLTGRVARLAWAEQSGTWLRLATPPLRRAYAAGGLSGEQATRAATAYAASLGEHLGESSGQALIDGFNAQLALRWPERTAWQRAAAGYGLDGPRMLAWVKGLLGLERVPSQRRVDELLMARALLLGDTEAFRARNSGKVLGWVWMAANGLLEVGTQKMWRTARDELTCPFCRVLDGQTVALDEPFLYPDGTEIFCPPAHPHCRCEPDLTRPPPIAKAYDPREKREPKGGPGAGRWAETEAPAKEQTETATPNPYRDQARSPYARSSNPYARASTANPYSKPAANPYSKPSAPVSASPYGAANPYARTGPRRREELRRVFVLLPPRPLKQGELESGRAPEYIVTRSELGADMPYFKEVDAFLPTRSGPGSYLDFDRLIAYGNFTHEQLLDMGRSGVRPREVVLEPDLGYQAPRAVRMDPDVAREAGVRPPNDLAAEFWAAHNPEAVRIEAATRAQTVTAFLGGADLDTIFALADYRTTPDGLEVERASAHRKRQLIVGAFQPGNTAADVALANAFMDYVAYARPALSGPKGELLNSQMQAFASPGRARVGLVRFNYVPHEDVFVFAEGFQPDSGLMVDASNREFKLLGGKYKVEHVSYQSTPSTPGLAAIRWIYLSPG